METFFLHNPACRLEECEFVAESRAFPHWECHAGNLRSVPCGMTKNRRIGLRLCAYCLSYAGGAYVFDDSWRSLFFVEDGFCLFTCLFSDK